MSDDDRRRLRDQHYGISDGAARTYAEHEQIDPAVARHELEAALGDAVQSPTNPNNWRLRSRLTGLDISIVTRDDDIRGHLVVTALNIRSTGTARVQRPSNARRQDLRHAASGATVPESGRAAPLKPSQLGDEQRQHSVSARPGARVVVDVTMTDVERDELRADLRGGESMADLLLASGLATARARARARKSRG